MNFASIILTTFFEAGVRPALQAGESVSQPSAQGIIRSSTVVSQRGSKGGTTCKPEVAYEYRSDLIAYGLKGSSSSPSFAITARLSGLTGRHFTP